MKRIGAVPTATLTDLRHTLQEAHSQCLEL
jgi:hypothetical protein